MPVAALGLLFLEFDDGGVGGEEEGRDGGGVLEGYPLDLGGDDDAHGDEVAVFVGDGVVAEVGVCVFLDFGGDDGAVEAAVGGDLLDGC